MKILHVLNNLSSTGSGIANLAVDLAVAQVRSGHEVHVASGGGGHRDLLLAEGVRLHPLEFRSRGPLALVRNRSALRRLVVVLAPDVVHAHTIAPAVIASTLRGRPALVATVHNEWQRGVSMMRVADRLVGVSDAVSGAMLGRGTPTRKVVTVPNGVLGSARGSGRVERIRLPGRSIVAVGSVSERKGADVLVRAFQMLASEFPDLHLCFVGNVDWQEPRRLALLGPGSERVRFAGFEAHPARYLEAASVFVMASRDEPFGLSLVEALAAGVPSVASRTGGIVEILDAGRYGLLVEPGVPEELAAAIRRILLDDDLAARLRSRARARAADFSVAAMATGYEAVYREVCRPAP